MHPDYACLLEFVYKISPLHVKSNDTGNLQGKNKSRFQINVLKGRAVDWLNGLEHSTHKPWQAEFNTGNDRKGETTTKIVSAPPPPHILSTYISIHTYYFCPLTQYKHEPSVMHNLHLHTQCEQAPALTHILHLHTDSVNMHQHSHSSPPHSVNVH